MRKVSVKKLKESDIYLNDVIAFTDPDGIEVELKDSWNELIVALITCINNVRKLSLVETLSNLKMFNGKLVINKGNVKHTDFLSEASYGIYGTDYTVNCRYNANEYLKAIKNMCDFLKFDTKQCFIELQQKKNTEQELALKEHKKSEKTSSITRIIMLKDIYNNTVAYNIIGVLIKNERYNCKNILGAIKAVISTDLTKIVQLYKLNNDKFNIALTADGIQIKHSLDNTGLISMLFKICKVYELSTYEVGLIVKDRQKGV